MIGSTFTAAMERVAKLVRGLREDGHTIRYVDAGGGLGIAYTQLGLPEFADFAARYAAAVTTPLPAWLRATNNVSHECRLGLTTKDR